MKLLTAQAIADEGELEVLGFTLPRESKQARAADRRLRSEGTTIVMPAHYIEEAQPLADTVLITHRRGDRLLAAMAPRRRLGRPAQARRLGGEDQVARLAAKCGL